MGRHGLGTGVLIAIALALSAAAQPAAEQTANVATVRSVTFCDVSKGPSSFNGAKVRLTAFVSFSFEEFVMWDPSCPRTESDLGLWLTYGGMANSGAVYCCPGEGIARTTAVPYP